MKPKIGVFICHCGTNIAGTVDVKEVVDFISRQPNVAVARHYTYVCSQPGQDLIKQDIKELGLDRVVVAACSPQMHELTFRKACEGAGLNRYLFQMANIREHCAWIHTDKKMATEKAKAILNAAVRRVAWHEPLQASSVRINPATLIVGGGIAGIQAALEIAESGNRVYLIEKEPTIGGHMAKFDKTFPTLDCAACILTPKMSAVKANPNITVWSYSEVTDVQGYIGNFKVKVKRKPRFISEDLCVGCLECIEACVYKEAKFKDEFNQGLGNRKPVYIPFPQAVPNVVVIDPETCIEVKRGKCKKTCVEACGERNAIDFTQKEEIMEIEVGAILLATGYQIFDASQMPQFGYGVYPNVFTSLEAERMLTASGPTAGKLVLKDGRQPKAVAIIHCVGSRDENHHKYCSRVCCMYALKFAHLIKERTDAEVYQFYIDMRAYGKGFEEFYNRVMHEGSYVIRGKAAEVVRSGWLEKEDGHLLVRCEDTLIGKFREIPVDMVILCNALEPRADAVTVRQMFSISLSADGFFLERHPKLDPTATMTEGVYIAGCCQGPKDIPDTVAQASSASARILATIQKGEVQLEPIRAVVNEELCSGCRMCNNLCPYTAILFDVEKKVSRVNEALCKGCGTCVAGCPSAAITGKGFTNQQIFSEIEGILV